jgi:structure-specific recognition protein 1
MQKSIIFVHKPVLYMKIDDIGVAIFHRIGSNSKLFDLEFKRKSTQQSQMFTSFDKQELQGLKDFFKSKNVKFESEDESKIHL